jgi:hypothetical protein
MKWWLLVAAKGIGLGGLYLGGVLVVDRIFPKGMTEITPTYEVIIHLGYAFSMLGVALVTYILAYFAWIDQRYRCRTCARRLRMPVASGSWSKATLFAPPKMEWICSFGHGTMRERQLQISGKSKDEWSENDDNFWKAFEDAWRKD